MLRAMPGRRSLAFTGSLLSGLSRALYSGAMIRFNAVSKRYVGHLGREVVAVDDLSLEVTSGEFLVLFGESGCGKTTTLKMINRLIEPTTGTIEVDGRNNRAVDAVSLRRGIGYVFQGTGPFPHLTIAENIAVVPRLLKWEPARIKQRVDALLDLFSLPSEDYRDRLPAQLSGGQRQRVGVARALAAEPKIMLMDEPFGAIDPRIREGLQTEFRSIHDRLGLTTVMVTHDMTEGLLLADRVAVMREGKLLRIGTPREVLTDPRNDYVAQLMKTLKTQADRLEAIAEGANSD